MTNGRILEAETPEERLYVFGGSKRCQLLINGWGRETQVEIGCLHLPVLIISLVDIRLELLFRMVPALPWAPKETEIFS